MKVSITIQAEVERYNNETLAQFRDRYNIFKAQIGALVDRGILPEDIIFMKPKFNFGGDRALQPTTIKIHRCGNMDCEHYNFIVRPIVFSGVETCPTCSGETVSEAVEAQMCRQAHSAE